MITCTVSISFGHVGTATSGLSNHVFGSSTDAQLYPKRFEKNEAKSR